MINNATLGKEQFKRKYVTIETLQKDQKNKKKGADGDLDLLCTKEVESAIPIEGNEINEKKKEADDGDLHLVGTEKAQSAIPSKGADEKLNLVATDKKEEYAAQSPGQGKKKKFTKKAS